MGTEAQFESGLLKKNPNRRSAIWFAVRKERTETSILASVLWRAKQMQINRNFHLQPSDSTCFDFICAANSKQSKDFTFKLSPLKHFKKGGVGGRSVYSLVQD